MVLPGINSLMYEMEAENIYEDFYNDKNLFHIGNYPKD